MLPVSDKVIRPYYLNYGEDIMNMNYGHHQDLKARPCRCNQSCLSVAALFTKVCVKLPQTKV
jgi:hypothetical protein